MFHIDDDTPAPALDLSRLNERQREAVVTTDGPLLVVAGAGSGKTRVICYRISHLIMEKRLAPHEILAVTFTNKAAGEMRERVEKLTGLSARSMWVSTFHSAALRILRSDRHLLGGSRDFAIFDDGDSELLARNIMKEMGIDTKLEKPADFCSLISRAKDELLGPDAWLERSLKPRAQAEKIHEVYSRYEEGLRKANALDFGDLIFETVRLLGKKEALDKYAERFKYILVDEYQDTNAAQCRLIQLLSSKHRNLCVVGDDDQSIYEWRGADRRNILSFESTYPEAKVVVLDRNYRSTQPILDAASSLIAHNIRIREKKLYTKQTGGAKPKAHFVMSEYAEAEAVVKEIKNHVRDGVALKDHAIFFRVHAQSRVLEEVLSSYSIPYQLLSGVSFYQRAEIKDVMAYLKLVANPHDDVSFRRIVNKPARGIGDVTVEKLSAASAGRSLFDTCRAVHEIDEIPNATRLRIDKFVKMMDGLAEYSKERDVAELLHETLSATAYIDMYDARNDEDEERIENVREFLSVAEEFQSSSEEASLPVFLERTALASDVDALDDGADTVILSTLHSAKGLEFDHVYIVGCEETLLPHAHAYREIEPKELEEERRLVYVGFTRAKKSLDLYVAFERRIYGRLVTNLPSRFLKEARIDMPVRRAEPSPLRFQPKKSFAAPKITASDLRPVAAVRPPIASKTGTFSEGDTVMHRKFGRGTVLYVADGGDDNETVQVKFTSGVRTLMTKYAGLVKG